MVRTTGQMSTHAATIRAVARPVRRPANKAMIGCHRLAATVAASRVTDTQTTQNTIFDLRAADRRTGSSMTVTVPERRPRALPRLDLDMTKLLCRGFVE
jgi:hypothetical protein